MFPRRMIRGMFGIMTGIIMLQFMCLACGQMFELNEKAEHECPKCKSKKVRKLKKVGGKTVLPPEEERENPK